MAIHATIASWRSEITRRKQQTRDSFAVTVKKIALMVGTRIVRRTPLLTGRASGSWNVSFGGAQASDIGPGIHSGAKEGAIGNIAAALDAGITSGNPWRRIYFNNTVPYIDVLERGHSTQAPAGMVRISLLEVRAELRARIA